MQVKCPKCATVLKLASPPASGKVKCPKCAAVLNVGAGKSAPRPSTANQPGRSTPSAAAAPAHAPTPAPAASAGGDFDFSNLPGPVDVPVRAYQQLGELSVHVAEPEPETAADAADAPPNGDAAPTPNSTGSGKKKVIIAGSVLVVLLCVLSGGGFFAYRMMAGGKPTSSAPARVAPTGFEVYAVQGVSVFMPRGRQLEISSGKLKYNAIQTPKGTIFMMGSADGYQEVLTGDKLKREMERLTMGSFRGGMSANRNSYTGEKGVVDKSTRFAPRENTFAPQMVMEIYQDDGRVILIGVAQDQSRGENIVIGQSREPEVEKEFYESIQIGPKPAGGFF